MRRFSSRVLCWLLSVAVLPAAHAGVCYVTKSGASTNTGTSWASPYDLQTALGTPAVYRARTVRELQQLKADPDAAPAATREFSRSDKLFVRVPAYAAGGTTPQLTAHVLNRAGDPINELPVTPASPGGEPQIDLALSAFPPGEYILEIKPAGDGASSDSRELVAFRIVG